MISKYNLDLNTDISVIYAHIEVTPCDRMLSHYLSIIFIDCLQNQQIYKYFATGLEYFGLNLQYFYSFYGVWERNYYFNCFST